MYQRSRSRCGIGGRTKWRRSLLRITARLGRRDAHGSRGLYVVRVDAERRPATRTMLLIQ